MYCSIKFFSSIMLVIALLLNHTLLCYPGIFAFVLTDISPQLICILKCLFIFLYLQLSLGCRIGPCYTQFQGGPLSSVLYFFVWIYYFYHCRGDSVRMYSLKVPYPGSFSSTERTNLPVTLHMSLMGRIRPL